MQKKGEHIFIVIEFFKSRIHFCYAMVIKGNVGVAWYFFDCSVKTDKSKKTVGQ